MLTFDRECKSRDDPASPRVCQRRFNNAASRISMDYGRKFLWAHCLNRQVLGNCPAVHAKQQNVPRHSRSDLDQVISRPHPQTLFPTDFRPIRCVAWQVYRLRSDNFAPDSTEQAKTVSPLIPNRTLMPIRCSDPGSRNCDNLGASRDTFIQGYHRPCLFRTPDRRPTNPHPASAGNP